MANTIPNSPITLESDRAAWSSIPQLPVAVQDAFGPKAIVMGQRGRWCGLVPRDGTKVFAWLDGRELKPSGLTTDVFFTQSLETDAKGRALVIGDKGNSLYAVGPDCAATCLGVLPEGEKIRTACWLSKGGVAAQIGKTIAIYTPGPDGRLLARLRFDLLHPDPWGLRCLNLDEDPDVLVLAVLADEHASIHAIPADAQVRTLADFDGLQMADIRLFLDETGNRTWLPEGAAVSTGGDLTHVQGIADALGMLDQLPHTELSFDAAPELAEGPNIPPPGADAKLEVEVEVAPDALTPPPLERLGKLTAALIEMLRAAPKRSKPDESMLKLIRAGMPEDLRAYVHAWACHGPNNPSVYEFWMTPPKLETREFIREHAGDSISLGTFASGEPIVGRLSGVGSCEVVMIDEEGLPYRYSGLEGFLRDLQMRAPDDEPFDLDAWMD